MAIGECFSCHFGEQSVGVGFAIDRGRDIDFQSFDAGVVGSLVGWYDGRFRNEKRIIFNGLVFVGDKVFVERVGFGSQFATCAKKIIFSIAIDVSCQIPESGGDIYSHQNGDDDEIISLAHIYTVLTFAER